MEKKEKYNIEIERIGKSDKKEKLRGYFSYPLGESYFDFSKKEIYKFLPGKKYEGVFSVSGMKDFLEDEEKEENICTWSYCLEKIINKNNEIVFESEEGKKKRDVSQRRRDSEDEKLPPGIIR